ncbi:MAG: LytTR family DNA-binding domain-containing protein [Verrucomicrobiae bacterium]|nr:LytTR family DNA-binding domain-containing protein [Verrucomicrobiae bacterium]
MKCLIIDDERLAREELKKLLSAHPQVHTLTEAKNPHDALLQIAELKPDFLFLDIKMPGLDGFELLEKIEGPVPLVIFTTAYSDFALRAFEVSALDYLLKPIDPQRLSEALNKVSHQLALTGEKAGTDPGDPPESLPSGLLRETDRVFVKENEQCWFVEVRQIRRLESEGNYTRIHFDTHKPLLLRSLSSLEARLNPKVFFRANRAQIINLNYIEHIEPWFSNSFKVHLKGGDAVELSRRQAKVFREQMSL